jgi:hypothetical protein
MDTQLSLPSTGTAAITPAVPLSGPLTVQPVNANVHSVHLADGTHAGNLKRVGMVWKFKAVGYDTAGAVEPGGGSLTHQHNMVFAQPDAAEVSARLLASHADIPPH